MEGLGVVPFRDELAGHSTDLDRLFTEDLQEHAVRVLQLIKSVLCGLHNRIGPPLLHDRSCKLSDLMSRLHWV